MKRGIRATLFVSGALAAAALAAPVAQADPAVAGEFDLPAGSTVNSNTYIVAGPDGNLWITTAQNTIVRMKPDGTSEAFAPPGMTSPASDIVVGPDGNLWASQPTSVIKIPPDNPLAANQTNITGLANGQGITVGPDGNIWLAGTDLLVKIPPGDPTAYTKFTVSMDSPKDMTTGSDGVLWVSGLDNASGQLLSATVAAPTATTPYVLGGAVQAVGAGPDGQVAWADPQTSPQSIGLATPGGTAQPFPLENTDPFGVVFGQDGAYWIARSQGNDLARMTTDGTITFLTGFAASGGVGPRKIATGPDNTLWVTLETPEKIAKVTGVDPPVVVPPPPPPPDAIPPETTIDKSPDKPLKAKEKTGKAKAKVVFSATGTAPSFECTLTKKGKDPKVAACTSPVKYQLKPGKYKFAVVATADGLTDASPATAKFKVKEP